MPGDTECLSGEAVCRWFNKSHCLTGRKHDDMKIRKSLVALLVLEVLAGAAHHRAAAADGPPAPATSTGSLRGSTITAGGAPLAGVRITVHGVQGIADLNALTDTQGQFRFDTVQPGSYEIRAFKDGFAAAGPVFVEIASNAIAQTEVSLSQEPSDATPAAASSEPPLTEREKQLLERITKLEGRLATVEGNRSASAGPEAAGLTAKAPSAESASATGEAHLPLAMPDPAPGAAARGAVRGVTLAPTGEPLADVNIVVRSLTNATERRLVSDSKGVFAADDLQPGPYQVMAFKEKFSSPATTVEIAQNQVAKPSLSLQADAPAEPEKPAKIDPFSDRDATWANGNTRTHSSPLDSKYFTGEFRADIHFGEDFNQPKDNSMGGSSEVFRNGEVQVEQLSLGGDLHINNVRGRILTMFGMFSTTTPRNDPSYYKGQWQLNDAYRYIAEAWGGYHINKLSGINIDAGIFVSYVGLFSYYNHDNWAYQPSYVSSNTPWFFNGVRMQFFVTPHLKIEPWIINGWQAYARPNGRPGLGGQLRWQPKDWFIFVANQYGLGEDTVGIKGRERLHTDDSIEVRYFNRPDNGKGISKMAFSVTGDMGCETGAGVSCHGGAGGPKQSFLGWMAYNRIWWHHDLFAWTLGGGAINNNGRYLTLTPPIDGATAGTGTPYFTQNPGDRFKAWDATSTWDYMPKEFITFRLEFGYRHASVPYWTGRGGITPPGGNNGSPGQFVCMDGTPAPDANSCGTVGLWRPDLRKGQALLIGAIMVKF